MISDDQMDTTEMESQSQRYEQELEIICDFGQLRDDLQDLHEDEEPVKFDELAATVRIGPIFFLLLNRFHRFEKLEIESSEPFLQNFELRTALRMSAKNISRQSLSVRMSERRRKRPKLPSSSYAVNVETCL